MELFLMIRIFIAIFCCSSGIFSDSNLNITMFSQFPATPMVISWTALENRSEEVLQYLVWVKDLQNTECVVWITINCFDCSDEIANRSKNGDFLNNCTNLSNNNTFGVNQSYIAITLTSSMIQPYKSYQIFVIPISNARWYIDSSLVKSTAEYISGIVQNITMTSNYPSSPMLLTWSPPSRTNGQISQYIVWVNSSNKGCVGWLTIDCSDCINMMTGNNGDLGIKKNCRNISAGDTFKSNTTNLTIITMSLTSPVIVPYTTYVISVASINGYGWGNVSFITRETSQYISDPVTDLTLSSQFTSMPININWTAPINANGEILQYIIYVKEKDTNECTLWLSINCSDCHNKILGANGSKNLSTQCKYWKDYNQSFKRNQSHFTINMLYKEIQPYVTYQVFIIPINSYGWGFENSASIKTGEFISGPVRNVTLISNYPSKPLEVNWLQPLNSKGIIVQYLITVRHNDSNKTCLLWWTINCTDCGNKTIMKKGFNQNNNECSKSDSNIGYFMNDTAFSTISNHSDILPDTKYVINVIPINGFAWGESTSNVIKTAEYKSDMVNILTVTGNFPRDNLIIRWKPPTSSRGQIISYYIFLYKEYSDNCIGFINVSLTKINMIEIQTSNILGCHSLNNVTFVNKVNEPFSLYITDPIIQPNHNFTVTVIPINGYGLGFNHSQNIQTISYQPLEVELFESIIEESNIILFWSPPLEDIFDYTYQIRIAQSNEIVYPVYNISQFNTTFFFDNTNFCTIFNICISTSTPFGDGKILCIKNETGPSFVTTDNLILKSIQNSINVSWVSKGESSCLTDFVVKSDNKEVITTNKHLLILNLKYYTIYNVTVTPFSMISINSLKRKGMSKSGIIQTAIGKPEKVQDFSCTNVTFNEFKCSWKEPIETNGPVMYDLQCKDEENYQDMSTYGLSVFISDQVIPDVNYSCQIQAKTAVGPSEPSFTSIKIDASKVPDIINPKEIPDIMLSSTKESTASKIYVTLPYNHFTENLGHIRRFALVIVVNNRGSIIVSSDKPTEKTYTECNKGFNCPYEITMKNPQRAIRFTRATNVGKWTNENYLIGSDENCAKDKGYNCNGPLGSNTEYVIGFRAYTSNGFTTVGFIKKSTKYDPIPVSVSVTVVFVILSISILGFILYRYRRNTRSSEEIILPLTDDSGNELCPKIKDFEIYYNDLMKDSSLKATEQFLNITQKCKKMENDKKLIYILGNEMKNRYKNIKPYEHNMIRLKDPDDYINASRICIKHLFIDTNQQCDCSNIYIATQGPLRNGIENKLSTIGDFWRMAYQYDVRVIVNLTSCVESYKEKCAQYWPEKISQKETYISEGHNVDVILQRITANKIFEELTFIMRMDNLEKSITQLHLTAWTDHGCPEINHFINFYNRFNILKKDKDSVIVHCSAGVGRTGTFILIDTELQKLNSYSSRIDIYDTLLNLRRNRCLMVQTNKQYIFVHDIIYEYMKRKGIQFNKKKSSKLNHVEYRYSYRNPAFDEQSNI